MAIDELNRLIHNGEHRQQELKKTTGELKDGVHTACAFLNTDGGWLVFGVTPKSLRITYYNVESATKVTPRDMYEERLRRCKPDLFAW